MAWKWSKGDLFSSKSTSNAKPDTFSRKTYAKELENFCLRGIEQGQLYCSEQNGTHATYLIVA